MAMWRQKRRWVLAVSLAGVAALGAGLLSSFASAQLPRATVTAYGFEFSCDATTSEGSTLACTLSNTADEAADWPTVAIVHLSSDDDRALVVGAPVDVAFGELERSPETEDDVWWIGDVLVGYSRFDWVGQATASSESETTDSRTVNIVVADDTAWEQAESFYVALAPSEARGVGFLYDSRQKITIGQSDSKSSDATLTSLEISAGGTTTEQSPPLLRPSLDVDYTTTEFTLVPTATYKPSGISVAVGSGAGYSFEAESGEQTRAIPLAVGPNAISVTVTAENGTSSQTYELAVERASLVDGAAVTVNSDNFSLTCPGAVDEDSTMECTLTNLSTSPVDWPVVAFLHSSADVSRALIAEDPIIPQSSVLYNPDIRLKIPQVPEVDNYNFGFGELFSGGSRSVYATYGYQKFDWQGTAAASASRTVFVEILADDLVEGNEYFYAAIADSDYTGLSNLVDNKVPIVLRGTSSSVLVEALGGSKAAQVFWIGVDAIDGEPVTSYDLRYIRSDATDRSDEHWDVRTSIWNQGDESLAYELTGLVDDVSYDIQIRAVAGTTTGSWSLTDSAIPTPTNYAPAFPDTETGQRDVDEGTAAGSTVGAPISAIDREGDTLWYSLLSGGDVFDIGANTGQLTVKSELDYETAVTLTHSVVVAVSDRMNADSEPDAAVDATKEVTVSVIDVNEPPALFGPESVDTLSSGALGYWFDYPGVALVGAYSALDPEGDDVSWSLGGADGASFEISAEGVLSFLSPPGFDAPVDADSDDVYEVNVQVTDNKDAAGDSDPAVDAVFEVTVTVVASPSPVAGLELRSDALGEITVSWDAAMSPEPEDYLVACMPADESWLSSTERKATAYSSSASHRFTSLDPAVMYKCRVAARYGGDPPTSTRRWQGLRSTSRFARPTGEGAPVPVPEGTALAGIVSAGPITSYGTDAVGFAALLASGGTQSFNTHYYDGKVFNNPQIQLAGLAQSKGAASFGGVGEESLNNAVILAIIPSYGHSVETPFLLEVDGRVLASTQAVVPDGRTRNEREYWLWDDPCVDWQIGDTLEMSIAAVDDSDPRLLAQSDASLSSLNSEDAQLYPAFDPEVTDYTMDVWSDVDQITITAEATDSNACGLTITPGDADETADGHQIDVSAGAVTVAVTVTAASDNTSKYRALVQRVVGVELLFERRNDLDLDVGTSSFGLRGVWTDSTTVWVASSNHARLLAFDVATGERQTRKEFSLARGPGLDDLNVAPSGIWSDGSTMWVADYSGRIFAYELATGRRQTSLEFDDVFDGQEGQILLDIWSNGSTMWVVNFPSAGVFAYSMDTRARQPQFDISAETMWAADNALPSGLWADGSTMWVADIADDTAYAYHLSSGERLPHLDFDDPDPDDSSSPQYLGSDGSNMWLIDDFTGDTIFAYVAQRLLTLAE